MAGTRGDAKRVTERDFRKLEYREADPEDYEFDADGIPVRKDRWETAIRRIVSLVGIGSRRTWTVDQVVDRVREAVGGGDATWLDFPFLERDHYDASTRFVVRLEDGSLLRGVEIGAAVVWRGQTIDDVRQVKVDLGGD